MAAAEEPEQNPTRYTDIVRTMSREKFVEILGVSTRQSREAYFARHGIKTPPSPRGFAKPGAKNEIRAAGLYDALQERVDEQLSEELLRTWLLNKRPLLAAALDHLKIDHDNGLTESNDVDRFEKLEAGEVKSLVTALKAVAPADEVAAYLKYMGAQHVDAALG
jgi:hypothetical protein